MRRLLFLLLLLPTPAFANTITIGTFTYLGTNSQGYSTYQAAFNSVGILAHPVAVNFEIGNQRGSALYGTFTTADTLTIGGYGSGAPNCPCTFVSFFAYFPKDKTLLLANGETFIPWKNVSPFILALPGESFVIPGQSTPIIIESVPEPGTALLIGIGLVGLVGVRKHVMKQTVHSSIAQV